MIHEIDPLSDPRWSEFVDRHPSGSVFHTAPWLELLSATYAYKPAVLTTTGPHGDLLNGIVFCRVQSRLTGNRLVSLPFSDHCEPLVDNPDDLQRLSGGLAALAKLEKCRYVELRPLFPLKNTSRDFRAERVFIYIAWTFASERRKSFGVFTAIAFSERSGVPKKSTSKSKVEEMRSSLEIFT
jgi:hypothetical protein